MSALIEEQRAPSEGPGRRRRRRWPWVAGALVLALLVAFGVVAVTYAHTYQPLSAGSGGGGSLTDRTLKETTDGLESTNYVLVGPTGTRGTFEFTVTNDGPFAVHLLGLTAEEAPGPIGLRWAPTNCGGYGCDPGLLRESRSLPVTIPARGAVFLLTTISQPRCSGDRGMSMNGFVIRWSALGVHHLFDVNLSPAAGPMMPIYFCPTARIARLVH